MITEPIFELDAFPTQAEFEPLWLASWGNPVSSFYAQNLARSLCHGVIWDGETPRLIGFVNVAWDGGAHAFLLDTTVHPDFQRQGLATELVRLVTEEARARGAEWLHVDFEPHLESFYRGCGFRPTAAGLLKL